MSAIFFCPKFVGMTDTDFLNHYSERIADAIEKYQFKSQPQELYAPMNYIINHAGKRLRPMMLLMATDAFGGDIEKALKPALAIEYFHNFTLIHDDIMDDAPLRRGVPTIHTVHGINTAILSGDGMLLKAYKFFEDLEPELFKPCIRIFTHTGVLLCEGQQYDVNFETQENVSYNDYLRMITYKTGILAASAFEIGAIIAKAPAEDAKAIFKFGLNLGIAFQIMDDYLDVFGDVKQFGKKHAGDIYENKKTILYLMARDHATEEERKELEFWYSKKTDNIDKIYGVEKIFKRNKVDEKAIREIQKHTDMAFEYLERLNISEEKKKPLMDLSNYLLKRVN